MDSSLRCAPVGMTQRGRTPGMTQRGGSEKWRPRALCKSLRSRECRRGALRATFMAIIHAGCDRHASGVCPLALAGDQTNGGPERPGHTRARSGRTPPAPWPQPVAVGIGPGSLSIRSIAAFRLSTEPGSTSRPFSSCCTTSAMPLSLRGNHGDVALEGFYDNPRITFSCIKDWAATAGRAPKALLEHPPGPEYRGRSPWGDRRMPPGRIRSWAAHRRTGGIVPAENGKPPRAHISLFASPIAI